MQFFEVIKARRSIRRFTAQPVSEDHLHQVLEAACLAPSAGNLQAFQIYVVKDPAIRHQLDVASGDQGAISQAPLVLVFCAVPSRSSVKYGARGEQLFCLQDATIACAYAQLAATALGLATVWVGAVHEPEVVKEALHLQADVWPIAFLPIGYPAETPSRKTRRPLTDLIRKLS